MTSSTTRAFMAKKQSTSFAQVATNLLNVLQGYSKTTRLLLVMFLTLTASTAWGDTYNFSNIPTTGWKEDGGSQTINGKSWTYSSATYIGVNNSRIQVGSKDNPQTTNWTIQIPINDFGTNIKVTKVAITAYTTRTTATYDISVSGSSVKNGSLTTSSDTYSSNTLNATTGNIVVTLKGSSDSRAMYLSNIAVTYETVAATSYTVTYNANGGSGTMSNSTGSSITLKECTFTAPSGKEFDEWNTAANGSGASYQAGDIVNESLNLYAIWKELPKYTVTWKVNGEVYEMTQVTEGSKPTFPATPASCDDESDTFYGWSTATWDGKINDVNGKTIYTSANNMPEVNGAVTYYAVFAKTSEDSSGDYKLVTSSSNLKSGVAYLGSQISYSGVRYYYMSSTAISSNLLSISNATVSSNILQNPNSEGKINLVSTGTANQYYIKNAEGKYLYSNAAGSLSWSTTACSWTFSNMNSTTGLAELTSSANSNIKLRAYGTSTIQGKLKTYIGTTNYGICVFLAEATTTYSDYRTTCSAQPSYSVTIADNIENGEVTANPTSATAGTEIALTATPTNGYQFSSWIVTKEGGGTVEVTNNKFTMPASNVTVSATFTALPKHTITWSVNGTTQSLSPSSVTDGSNLGTLPTPNLDGICEGKTFVGWTTEANNNYFNETTPPLFIEATTQPEGNTTYYAVFATQEQGGTKTITFSDQWTEDIDDLSKQTGGYKFCDDIITLTFAKPGGQTNPAYKTKNNAVRLYYGNTMKVSSTSTIQTITLTFVSEDANTNSISTNPDCGTLPISSPHAPYTWTINDQEVTFQIGTYKDNTGTEKFSGHRKISKIDIVTADGGAASYSDYTTSCGQTYTITWKNYDGTVLKTDNVLENTMPKYTGENPTKASTAQYTYTFNGWDPAIALATTDATYTATYTETLRNYTITWKNGETTLETDNNVPYGETPSYDGATPTKTATAQYTYTFHGWSPEVTSVTGDATYTATFTETVNKYQVTFNMNGHGTAPATQTIEYGSTATKPDNPTADGYSFVNWYKDADCTEAYNFNSTITDNITLYAKWSKIINVAWMVNGQSKGTTTCVEGAHVPPPTVNPIPCGAVLAGWTDAENGEYVHGTSTLYEGAKPSIEITEDKTFYAVFADSEGTTPEMPTVIAYWENQKLTKDEGVDATIGTGTMTSNIESIDLRTKTAYFGSDNTQPIIELTNLDLIGHQDICLSFWTRGSAGGTFTIEINDNTIATINVNKKDETLYIIENIPSTTTSITLSYGANSGSFFFGTVKLYEAPAAYSFEKLTAENTNGWTGSDWDGYYLITNGQSPLLALDGNAIFDGCYKQVEDRDNKVEALITMAFNVTYNSTESGYSLQGIGDGMYLNPTGSDGKEVGSNANAIYFPTIGYNQLKTSSDMFLSWNTNAGLLRFYNPSAESPQMYKIMSELSYRTLCEYEVTWLVGGEEYIAGTPTTTVQAGKTIAALPTNPLDNALGCCSDKFMGWTTSEAKVIENEYLYETLGEIQEKFPSIYENLTFRAVFATAAQGVGTSIADFSEVGYVNATRVTEPIILGDGEGHGDATITFALGSNVRNYPKYYTSSEAVHIYQGNTITIASTYHIKSVAFNFATGDGTNEITANSGTYVEGVWTEDVERPTNNLIFTIRGEAGQHRRIASITVTTGVSGSQYTNYVTKCTLDGDASLGNGTITYYQDGSAIAVNCQRVSAKSTAATLTFQSAQKLTCPITLSASEGFLLSTNKEGDTYAQNITVTPYKSGTNEGKLRKIYVRADATNKNDDYTGTITVTGGELNMEVSIDVSADVTCQSFTFKTLNHLGEDVLSEAHYAGDIIENAPDAPQPDDCSENYTFDGWSTSAVEYGSLIYNKVSFPFTMPAEDVALYPVYRINPTEDYHRVTSDFGANNWAGDYLIAYSPTVFADGRSGGTGDAAIGKANVQAEDFSTAIVNDVVPADPYGNRYHVTLESVEGGYVLKTQDERYNFIRNTETSGLADALGKNTAAKYPLTISFDKESHNVSIANLQTTNKAELRYTGERFGFYSPTSYFSIYLYKKSPLYTSSLICEEITAEDAMVTSTAGQTVKVNVTATMSDMTVIRNRTLTVERDNTDFDATITETAPNTYNVAVSYAPSAEDNKDGTETATITIKVNDNPVTTFQVTGRHLPENFVIAAKWGDNWYALPANCVNSGDSKQGILIDVNDINNPISATAPTTTKYGLHGVKPGRQTEYGQSILLTERVSNTQKALYQNNGANENIWVYAQYANYDKENPTYYEWIPSTNDLTNYTFTHSASSRKLGVNENGIFGAYTTDVQVRLLPATFYDQVAVQVIKWKANSVIVMYTGAETTATTQVGTNAATADQTLANQKITHGIYELTTTQSLTENAGKILTMCFGTTQVKVEVPLIVSEEVIASANGHDVVILNGGKLTAAATSYSYNTIYVYGGGKLAIPEGAQLGVNNIILRAGGIDGVGEDAIYQYIYPQVDLKGTLTAASQTFLKYEYVTDYDHWYHLVLPFNASLSTITYPQEYYGENVNADNKGSWVIKRYDGATRATGNYEAWKDIETDNPKATQVIAGKGYIYWGAPKKVTIGGDTQRQKWGIQRITMNKQAANATKEENGNKKISDLSSYATVEGNSGADNDQGWNLVGNPYMVNLTGLNSQSLQIGQLIHETDASGNWTGKWHWDDTSEQTGLRYVTIPSDHFETYEAKPMTWFTEGNPMIAGRSFFVQIAGDATDLVFDVTKKAALMPALLAENNDKPVDIETGIILSNETLQDEVNFWIKDGKTNDYEYNADYPKTPNNTNFNIYGVHAHGDLSWVAISPELAAESMPIGYQVPAAGTYMLSLSETYYSDDLQALYVTDHGVIPEVTTDLLSGAYEFSVNQAETNNERFTVSIILKTEEDDGGGDVGTGVDNAANNYRPYKFFYQDKLYILRNGIIYDAMGKQVKTINK